MKALTGPQAVALRKIEAAERHRTAPGVAPPSAYVELEALGLITPANAHERGGFRMTDAGRAALAADGPRFQIEDGPVDGLVIWHHTGKTGADRRTGERSAEYAELDAEGRPTGRRVWADFDGNITERNA